MDWYADCFSRSDWRNPKGQETGAVRVVCNSGRFDLADRLVITNNLQGNADLRMEDIVSPRVRCALEAMLEEAHGYLAFRHAMPRGKQSKACGVA